MVVAVLAISCEPVSHLQGKYREKHQFCDQNHDFVVGNRPGNNKLCQNSLPQRNRE
jgi:hypothetical protein